MTCFIVWISPLMRNEKAQRFPFYEAQTQKEDE